jgi:solute carrier family 25 protein 44
MQFFFVSFDPQRLPGGCIGGLSLPEMARDIYRRDGVRGFYKGFGASLAVNAPSSAIWWGTYGFFRDYFFRLAGIDAVSTQRPSGRALEALAGASAGVVSTILTNPMDVARTRLQVGCFFSWCVYAHGFDV